MKRLNLDGLLACALGSLLGLQATGYLNPQLIHAQSPAEAAAAGGTPAAEPAPAPEPPQPEPAPALLAPPPPPPAAAPSLGPSVSLSANPLDTTAPTSTTDISGIPGQGLKVTVGDAFSLNIRSRLQARYQLIQSQPDKNGDRTFDQLVNIGTARLYVSGNVLVPELTYMLQFALAGKDYRDGATSPVYDAYLDWKAHRDFNIQVGQFFVPFDRLRTIREWALQMADRPRPIQEATLDRDTGAVLYSDTFLGKSSPIAFRLGAFGGGGTNLTIGRKPGALLVGRIELRPLGPIDDDQEGDLKRRDKPALAIGAAVAENINTNRVRSTNGATFKSPTTSTYTGGTADYTHVAADLVFKWSGFALEGEYLLRNAAKDQVHSVDSTGKSVTEYTRSLYAWIVQASYVFPVPVEIVARATRMYAISGTDPSLVSELKSKGQELAGGLNYYINGHRLKLQADWIGRFTPKFERPENTFHFQIDGTF